MGNLSRKGKESGVVGLKTLFTPILLLFIALVFFYPPPNVVHFLIKVGVGKRWVVDVLVTQHHYVQSTDKPFIRIYLLLHRSNFPNFVVIEFCFHILIFYFNIFFCQPISQIKHQMIFQVFFYLLCITTG